MADDTMPDGSDEVPISPLDDLRYPETRAAFRASDVILAWDARAAKDVLFCGLALLRNIEATGVCRGYKAMRFGCYTPAHLKRLAAYCRKLKGQCDWLPEPVDLSEPSAERMRIRASEIARLFAVTDASGALFMGLTGRQRAAIYRLAVFAGLRASEIASLTAGDFDLDIDHLVPVVKLDAARSKSGCGTIRKLVPLLVDSLQPIASQALGDWQQLWPGDWWKRRNEMLRRDLMAAREDWVAEAADSDEAAMRDASSLLRENDEDGRPFDFNSLRKSYLRR